MKSKSFLLIFVTLFLTLNLLNAADDIHAKFTAEPSKQTVKAGEKFLIRLTVKIDKYWHTYSPKETVDKDGFGPTPSEIRIEPSSHIKLAGKVKFPKPKVEFDKGFEINAELYEGTQQFYIPVVAVKDLSFPKSQVNIVAYMEFCDTARCLQAKDYKTIISAKTFAPDESHLNLLNEKQAAETVDKPKSDTAKAALATSDTSITPKVDTKQVKTESETQIDAEKNKGSLSWLIFAISQGFLALLTPCVYPMVPITVSFFTKRAEGNNGKKNKGLIDSIVYALGIITTFTAVGVIFAIAFGSTGIQNFATSPWTNISLALLFVIFAFNLFGAFEIQLPTGILNKLNAKSQGGGYMSVLLMGLTFSLTSFTCTVPFVGGALTSAAKGDWYHPILGMLGFSAAFASPFFLLALFPSAMAKLPKAGGWMNNIKVVMGFLEIAAAMKFISNVDLAWGLGIMPREVFISIWIACGLLITLYILGVFRLSHDSIVDKVGSLRAIFALGFATITFILLAGLQGKQLGTLDAYLPPPDYEAVIAGSKTIPAETNSTKSNDKKDFELSWHDDYQAAVAESKKLNKPLFIDFTGVTCTNCRWMERNMFTKKSVVNIMKNMVLARLFTDKRNDAKSAEYQKMRVEKYNSADNPLYVILNPQGEVIATKAYTTDENEFTTFLKKAFILESAEN